MGTDYFYGFFGPGVSQWNPPLWENSTPLQAPRTPEEGYHLEADMADKTITWIQRQKSIHPEKPWVAYYAPSCHKPPVGVPREFIERYRGKFDDGYDQLRERHPGATEGARDRPGRHRAGAPARGASRRGTRSPTSTRRSALAGWRSSAPRSSTPITRSAASSRRSRRSGEFDNTLIIYIAGDNGPTPEGGLHGIMNKLSYWNGVPESLDDLASRIDDFGGPESHGCYPAAWAYATATPFTYGKTVTSGGGCSTSAVMSWPARIKDQGGIRRQFHHLIDIAPDHPGLRRDPGADAGQRHRPEADGQA